MSCFFSLPVVCLNVPALLSSSVLCAYTLKDGDIDERELLLRHLGDADSVGVQHRH